MSDSYEQLGAFYLGKKYDLATSERLDDLLLYRSRDLTTHGLCVGMTGSGKTGLCLSLIEEAAIDGIPVIAIDPKGDLSNLALTFPELNSSSFAPWIDENEAASQGMTAKEYAENQAQLWKKGLWEWDQDGERIRRFQESAEVAIYTPGSNAGRPLTVLRSFSAPQPDVINDSDLFRERVSSSVEGLLALMGMRNVEATDKEHILLSQIVSRAWQQQQNLTLPDLIRAIQSPGFDRIGFMDLESVFSEKDRFEFAMRLNNLFASPGFMNWMSGEPLQINTLLANAAGKPKISVLSIAHLSEAERQFFVTILLNEVISWMRSQSGSSSLRAILFMDEIYGYFPPVANPPTKQPMLTLLKQARAYGVGVVLATQNPVDLDYRGLSNIGTWFLGRLQTERDKARVLDGLESASTSSGAAFDREQADKALSSLDKRVFLMQNVHDDEPTVFQTRWALSYLRGPLSREEISKVSGADSGNATNHAVASGSSSNQSGYRHSAAIPSSTSTPERPVIPAFVTQRILVSQRPLAANCRMIYRPAILGRGQLHYSDRKSDIDLWQPYSLLVPVNAGVPEQLWASADRLADNELDFDEDFESIGVCTEPPAEALNKKSYSAWTKELKDYAYRELWLDLEFCPTPKMYSNPDETVADFRLRVRQVMREQRDLELEKLRAKFEKDLVTYKDRVRRAEERVDRESAQFRESSFSSAISFGSTVLGALFGNKLASRTNVSRTATSMRGASRAASQKADVDRAEDALEDQKEKLAKLEEEFQSEVEKLQMPISTEAIDTESYRVKPRKSDIEVDEVALAWLPYSLDPQGAAEPLYWTTNARQ